MSGFYGIEDFTRENLDHVDDITLIMELEARGYTILTKFGEVE